MEADLLNLSWRGRRVEEKEGRLLWRAALLETSNSQTLTD